MGYLSFLLVQGSWSGKWAATCQQCQTQADAGHGIASIGFRPPDTIFRLSWQTPSSGEWLTAVSASQKKYDSPTSAMRLRHSDVWNLTEMTLEINLYELTTPYECCILETEWMETQGNSLRFWNRKCINWEKQLFCRQICYFLGREFPYAGTY
jgi:hypothetical protein